MHGMLMAGGLLITLPLVLAFLLGKGILIPILVYPIYAPGNEPDKYRELCGAFLPPTLRMLQRNIFVSTR